MIAIFCMLVLAWLLPGEGTLRASLTCVVAVGTDWRGLRLAAVAVPYRPNRIYYRIAVGRIV